MYLVVECRTRSAPWASGFWRYGLAKVLSTTARARDLCATCDSAAMSTTLSVGFDGASIHTILVVLRIAFRTAPRSRMSTAVSATPSCSYIRLYRRMYEQLGVA